MLLPRDVTSAHRLVLQFEGNSGAGQFARRICYLSTGQVLQYEEAILVHSGADISHRCVLLERSTELGIELVLSRRS